MAATLSKLGRLQPASSVLFVCDIQDRFKPLITGANSVVDTANRMIRGAAALQIPVLTTEQYPKALGNTVEELKSVLPPGSPIFAKTMFSMVTPDVKAWLNEHKEVKQVMLLGIESHVCVLQTTLDLLADDYEVHLVVDAISSQRPYDRAVGLQRMAQAGAFLTTSEMLLFQLMRDAKHPAFKTISALAKEARAEPIPFTASL